MNPSLILFAILAAVTVVCGVSMIVTDNPVRSALSLVLVLFSVAILFLTLNASFIAAIQIIVYAGAIMVLFIFVIMLLNLGTPEIVIDRLKPQKWAGPILGILLVMIFAGVIVATPSQYSGHLKLAEGLVGPEQIGLVLYSPQNPWLLPFEVVSILLLVAAIGAIVLAKKRVE